LAWLKEAVWEGKGEGVEIETLTAKQRALTAEVASRGWRFLFGDG
jgi:hypothetical protein